MFNRRENSKTKLPEDLLFVFMLKDSWKKKETKLKLYLDKMWIKLAGGPQKVIEMHDRSISLLTKAKKNEAEAIAR
jgi:hypothetical protein